MKNPTEIITAGDTRFDQVCRRIDTRTVKLPTALSGGSRSFLIAGSTWPRDEDMVIPGFRRLLDRFPEACLIIVPHEPTPERLREIEISMEREKLGFHLLSTLDGAGGIEEPVVIADGLGYLAELYRAGCIAYVGGSFTTGVHNVMEPAVLGLPVFFGPRIDNSYEARKLVEIGAASIVRSPEDLEREAAALLSNRELLEKKGGTGSLFIRNHCGAALRCVDLIEKHLAMRKA
jgi:3-deoxy-D-manno-octulosonic-acid transferase